MMRGAATKHKYERAKKSDGQRGPKARRSKQRNPGIPLCGPSCPIAVQVSYLRPTALNSAQVRLCVLYVLDH